MSDRIAYHLADGVATITMDDGKVNVMSTAMLQDLGAAFRQAEKDQAIVVLRSGRKDIFSAGFDLKVFAASDVERSLEMVTAGAELALHLMSHPCPTIGILQGHAFPMGTFLLLACDLLRLDRDLRIRNHEPESQQGWRGRHLFRQQQHCTRLLRRHKTAQREVIHRHRGS